MLPKDAGQLRPIALLPGALRVWGRLRRPLAKAWELKYASKATWSINTRTCLRAGWQCQLHTELAVGTGLSSILLCCDICKYYEHIRWAILLQAAKLAKLPMRLATAAIYSYAQPRVIEWDSMCSVPMEVVGTILPGCALASTLAQVTLQELHHILEETWPELEVVNVMDDITLQAIGEPIPVAQTIVDASTVVESWLEEHFLPLAPSKTIWMASNATAAGLVPPTWEARGYNEAHEHRVLGAQTRDNGRRRMGVVKAKSRKWKTWLARAGQLRKAGAKTHSLLRTGVLLYAMMGEGIQLQVKTNARGHRVFGEERDSKAQSAQVLQVCEPGIIGVRKEVGIAAFEKDVALLQKKDVKVLEGLECRTPFMMGSDMVKRLDALCKASSAGAKKRTMKATAVAARISHLHRSQLSRRPCSGGALGA
eukprot:3478968-Amphidinium_carterae.1